MNRTSIVSTGLLLALVSFGIALGDGLSGGGSATPSGPAGGVLSGTYPNPGFAASPSFATSITLTGVGSTLNLTGSGDSINFAGGVGLIENATGAMRFNVAGGNNFRFGTPGGSLAATIVVSNADTNNIELHGDAATGAAEVTTSGGALQLAGGSGQVFTAGGFQLASGGLSTAANTLGIAKVTTTGTAPGAAGGRLELVCGTNAGSAKLIMYAGTSGTAITIVDNIGAGVTGC